MLASALLLSALVTPSVFGQSSALTGDWWGARSSLADNGVSLDLRYTSFYQGLASGTGDKGYEWFGANPAHEALTAYGLMEFRDMEPSMRLIGFPHVR